MCKRKETYGSCVRKVEAHNTHFKTDVKGKPCHGLNASYVDARTGALRRNKNEKIWNYYFSFDIDASSFCRRTGICSNWTWFKR